MYKNGNEMYSSIHIKSLMNLFLADSSTVPCCNVQNECKVDEIKSMEQSRVLLEQLNSSSDGQETCLLWNLKILYHDH
jgi:hypothetical protein